MLKVLLVLLVSVIPVCSWAQVTVEMQDEWESVDPSTVFANEINEAIIVSNGPGYPKEWYHLENPSSPIAGFYCQKFGSGVGQPVNRAWIPNIFWLMEADVMRCLQKDQGGWQEAYIKYVDSKAQLSVKTVMIFTCGAIVLSLLLATTPHMNKLLIANFVIPLTALGCLAVQLPTTWLVGASLLAFVGGLWRIRPSSTEELICVTFYMLCMGSTVLLMTFERPTFWIAASWLWVPAVLYTFQRLVEFMYEQDKRKTTARQS